MKLGMFTKLCVGNYATHDGLFNNANGIFKFATSFSIMNLLYGFDF